MSLVSKVERIGAMMGYRRMILATHHDVTDEAEIADAWMVSEAGSIKFVSENNVPVTITQPTILGKPYPYRTRRIFDTGTTAVVWLLYAYQTGEEGTP